MQPTKLPSFNSGTGASFNQQQGIYKIGSPILGNANGLQSTFFDELNSPKL